MVLSRRDVAVASSVAVVAVLLTSAWAPRLLPYGFLAGVASTLGALLLLILTSSRSRGSHPSTDLADPQPLAFTAPGAWAAERAALRKRSTYHRTSLYDASPAISDSIDALLDLTLRDFVSSWYTKISSSSSFTDEVDRAIRAALANIRDRVLALDLVELGVVRLLPIVNEHLKRFYDAERLVRGKNLTRDVTESEELDIAIARKYRGGHLHPAAALTASSSKVQQQEHLRRLVKSLLNEVLPPSMTTSPAVQALVRELVAGAVLLPIMQLLSDPDIWNQIIEAYGRSVLHDRKTVRKLRAALDEHAQPGSKDRTIPANIRLRQGDSERNFEKFIRAVRLCNNLPDARRFRSEVAQQLKRDSAVSGTDPLYLRRLDAGKKLLDQKVAHLSSTSQLSQHDGTPALQSPVIKTSSWREDATLRQVLYDASGLSYFMEYMDRVNMMSLVQFWIVVDGIRGPLQHDEDETAPSLSDKPNWTDSDRQDLVQISEGYLQRPEFRVDEDSVGAVNQFLKSARSATQAQYIAARKAVVNIQSDVFEQLKEKHFPRFCKSDLYYKWLASEDFPQTRPAVSARSSSEFSEPLLLKDASKKPGLKSAILGLKTPDIRRSVASSADLTSVMRRGDHSFQSRQSLDDASPRTPAFLDGDPDPLSWSNHSLESSTGARTPAVDAVQAALDKLMDEEPDRNSLFSEDDFFMSKDGNGSGRGLDIARTDSPSPFIETEKPSLVSLGLLGTPSKRTVFSQNDLFGEDEKLWEEGAADPQVDEKSEEEEIHEAAPGDLGLAEVIQSLTTEIEKLEAQQSIVDSLTRKAELTNNTAELRILRKSKTSLEREIHRKQMQKQQYIVQESDNSLFGKALVSIQSIMVGTEEDGHEFALYVIEVQRYAGEKVPVAAWIVTRRFSEFHELHRRLRSRFPTVRNLDFPRKQMVPTLQKDFLKKRKIALEKYLRELLRSPLVCRSIELRAFLSQQAIRPVITTNGDIDRQDFISRIYNSVTDGMEEFLGNIPVLDQLSSAGQNLISAASTLNPLTGSASGLPPVVASDPATAAEAEAEIKAFEGPGKASFIQPICDVFLEIFEFNKGNNWLRGRAVVVVIQQLLGGTIERRVRDSFKTLLGEASVLSYLDSARDTIWPGGRLLPTPPARTPQQKANSRKEAGLVLVTLLPDLAGSVVGRTNSVKAARRIFATLSNERLNIHLSYTILDELIDTLFGPTASRF